MITLPLFFDSDMAEEEDVVELRVEEKEIPLCSASANKFRVT